MSEREKEEVHIDVRSSSPELRSELFQPQLLDHSPMTGMPRHHSTGQIPSTRPSSILEDSDEESGSVGLNTVSDTEVLNTRMASEVEERKAIASHLFGMPKWKSHLTRRPLEERSSIVRELYRPLKQFRSLPFHGVYITRE